eukprot:scaffold12543_cov115-Isochrysis_galbana.AAC.11
MRQHVCAVSASRRTRLAAEPQTVRAHTRWAYWYARAVLPGSAAVADAGMGAASPPPSSPEPKPLRRPVAGSAAGAPARPDEPHSPLQSKSDSRYAVETTRVRASASAAP